MTMFSQWQPKHPGAQSPTVRAAFGRTNTGAPANVNPLLNVPSRVVPATPNNNNTANTAPTNPQSTTKAGEASQAVNKMLSESEYLKQRQEKMETWFAENMGMPPADKLAIGAAAGVIPTAFLKWAFGMPLRSVSDYFNGLKEAKPNAPIYRFAYWIDRAPIIKNISDAMSRFGANVVDHQIEGDLSSEQTPFKKWWRKQTWLTKPIDRALEVADAEVNNFLRESSSVAVVKNHVDEGMRSIEHLAPHRRFPNNTAINKIHSQGKELLSERAERLISTLKNKTVSAKPGMDLLEHEVLSEKYQRYMNAFSKLATTKDGEDKLVRQFFNQTELAELGLNSEKVTIKQLQHTLKPGLFKRISGKAVKLTADQKNNLHNIINLAKREKKYLRHLLGVKTRLEGFTSMHLYNYHLEKGMMDVMHGRTGHTIITTDKPSGTIGRLIVSTANAAREVLDGSFVMGHAGSMKGPMRWMSKMMPVMIPAMAIGMPLYEAGKAKFGDKLATFMHHLLGYEFGFFMGWQIGRNVLNEINFGTRLTQLIDQIPKQFEKGLHKIAKVFNKNASPKYAGRISHWLFKSRSLPLMGRISVAGFMMFMIFSQSFANRLKSRFEKISHAIFGYPESVRETEAKEKAEELASKINSMPPAFRNHNEASSFSKKSTPKADSQGSPVLGFHSRARNLLHLKSIPETAEKKSLLTAASTPIHQTRSAQTQPASPSPQGAGTLSNLRANTVAPQPAGKPQDTTAQNRLNPSRFFKRNNPQPSATPIATNVATTKPETTVKKSSDAPKPQQDPFSDFDPNVINTMPSNLPQQLANEQQRLAQVLSWQTA